MARTGGNLQKLVDNIVETRVIPLKNPSMIVVVIVILKSFFGERYDIKIDKTSSKRKQFIARTKLKVGVSKSLPAGLNDIGFGDFSGAASPVGDNQAAAAARAIED